jgi:hypothetical protein
VTVAEVAGLGISDRTVFRTTFPAVVCVWSTRALISKLCPSLQCPRVGEGTHLKPRAPGACRQRQRKGRPGLVVLRRSAPTADIIEGKSPKTQG